MKPRLAVGIAVGALLVSAVAVVAIPALPLVRENRFQSLSLTDLEAQMQRNAGLERDPIFLYHLGRRLNESERFGVAQGILEKAAGYAPGESRIRDEWTRSLVGQGQVSSAYALLMQFVNANPQNAEAQLLLGKFHLSQMAFPAAEKSLAEAVRLNPKSAESWSLRANTLLNLGEIEQARHALETALRLRPTGANSAADHLQMAVLLSLSDPVKARLEFEQAVQWSPQNAEAHREFARYLVQVGEWDRAEREARTAVELAPNDATAQLVFGRALLGNNASYEVIPPLERAAKLAPWDPRPAQELVRAHRRLKDKESADRWEREAVKRARYDAERKTLTDQLRAYPTNRKLRQRMAELLAQQGDVSGCVRESALALRIAPDSPRALVPAAKRLHVAGFDKEALPLIRTVTQSSDYNPEAFETLGDILLSLGRIHEAAVQYERIHDWKLKKQDTYRQQIEAQVQKVAAHPLEQMLQEAKAARRQKDIVKAEAIANKVLEADPEYTRALRFLLETYFALRIKKPEYHPAAIETGRKLVTLSPEDGVAQALYAVLLMEGEDPSPEEATKHLLLAYPDPAASAPLSYGRGLLALHEGKTDAAQKEFRQTWAYDTHADSLYPKVKEVKQGAENSKENQNAGRKQ